MCGSDRQLLTAQHMEMQVLHGLAGILADIGDHAVAVVQANFLGQLGDHGKDMAQQGTVLLSQGSGTLDVLFGHNKKVHLGLRVDIVKRHDLIVLIQLVRGDLALGEEFTRDDFIKAELALQDAKLEAGIDLEKEKSPGLIGKYHDWKKNRVRHKVNKKKYLLLCLFLGWCGGHRYYEKRYVLAAFYTLFFWSMVPFFLCVTDLLIALPMQADENGDILI